MFGYINQQTECELEEHPSKVKVRRRHRVEKTGVLKLKLQLKGNEVALKARPKAGIHLLNSIGS